MPFPLHTRSNIGKPARAAVRGQQKPPHNVQGRYLQFRRFSFFLQEIFLSGLQKARDSTIIILFILTEEVHL